MSLKSLVSVLALVLLVAVGWRIRHAEFWRPAPPAASARPIVFDNGTVRERVPASAPGQRRAAEPVLGAVRKCRRGAELSYTNHACPPGSREEPMGGHVNVVEGQRPAAPQAQAATDPAGPGLREQQIERAVWR